MFSKLAEHLRRSVTEPIEELRGIQYSVRYMIDLAGYCARELLDDRAEEMAAALTYRTIFALIPMFVIGLVFFRMFGGLEDVQTRVQENLYDFFGVPEVSYEEQSDAAFVEVETVQQELEQEQLEAAKEQAGIPADATDREKEAEEHRQFRVSLKKILTELFKSVANLSFTSIGVAGVILFMYAAMSLALSVEYDFNIIFDSPRGRPWHLRVAIYWSIITLGSGLLAISLQTTGRMVAWLSEIGVESEMAISIINHLLALLASWVLLSLLYLLMPNTKVNVRPALVGSLVAAVLWETGKVGFQAYVTTAVPYSALYASLGLIPLFLFWIYISWLIVLFGLELAYALQVMHGVVPSKEEKPPPKLAGDPDWFIPMLAQIGRRFLVGESVGRQELSEHLNLPTRIVDEYGTQLENAGMIHIIHSPRASDIGYVLARPPERIRIRDVLELGRELSRHNQHHEVDWEYVDKLYAAKFKAADGVTLAQLVEHPESVLGNGAPGEPHAEEEPVAPKQSPRRRRWFGSS